MLVRPPPASAPLAPAARPAVEAVRRPSRRLAGIRPELVADLERRALSARDPLDGADRGGASLDPVAGRAEPQRRDAPARPASSAAPDARSAEPSDAAGPGAAGRATRPEPRSIVPVVVDGWRRQGKPLDLVLDEPVPPAPAPSAPAPVRRSLGGTPSLWPRRAAGDARTGGAGSPAGPAFRDETRSPIPVPAAGDAPRAPARGPDAHDPHDPHDPHDGDPDGGGSEPAESGASRPSEVAGGDVAAGPGPPSGALAPLSPALPVTPVELVEPGEGPIVARDPTELGPSLPRRAGSLVRRWVTRIVSFVRRLPAKLGLDRGRGGGRDEGER